MKYIGIIPARYASTRFPAKPLALLGGKTVIERVYRQVENILDDVIVATDDQRILSAVQAFGGKAVMTSTAHKSGTDRVYEAYTKQATPYDVIVNIQGDEPFIQAQQLYALRDCFTETLHSQRRFRSPSKCQLPQSRRQQPHGSPLLLT